ncbi:hypothetical protein IFR05_015030 [Cadophora sp. M221]|nr:hypothetical protein IFR05_015030 [Cadophora sp. M221]
MDPPLSKEQQEETFDIEKSIPYIDSTSLAEEKISGFFDRPWIRWMWIVQEVANARDVIVHCGARHFDWNIISRAKWAAEQRLSNARSGGWEALPICRQILQSLEDSGCDKLAEERDRTKIFWRTFGFGIEGTDLLSHLVRYRRCECSNPRDKIFAVLNLASIDKDLALPAADYASSVKSVYTFVTKALIEHHHSLDVLCAPHAGDWRTPDDLPSWSPDWSKVYQSGSLLFKSYRRHMGAGGKYHPEGPGTSLGNCEERHKECNVFCRQGSAAKDTEDGENTASPSPALLPAEGTARIALKLTQSPLVPNEDEEARQLRNSENVCDGVNRRPFRNEPWKHDSEDVLSLNGVRCGVVKLHSPILNPLSELAERFEVVKQWANDHKVYSSSAKITELVHDAEERIALDFYPLLTSNHASNEIGLSEVVNLGIHKTFMQWLDLDVAGGNAKVTPGVQRLHDYLWETLKWWTMATIVSESGELQAMVPITAEDGDIAVVLLGCKLPLILRAREGEDNYNEPIGAMHCPVIMNGEVLNEFDRGERRKETFYLM